MEVRVDIKARTKRSSRLHNVNRHVFLGSAFISFFMIFAYLPIPSQYLQGFFWEPPLDFRTDWPYLFGTFAIFLISYSISNVNSVTRHGFLSINEESIQFKIGANQFHFKLRELDYMELSANEELYIRTGTNSYNLTLLVLNTDIIKQLNILFYKIADYTHIVIRN